jgi:hypothetical protein
VAKGGTELAEKEKNINVLVLFCNLCFAIRFFLCNFAGVLKQITIFGYFLLMKKIFPVLLSLFGCGSSNNASTGNAISTAEWEEATSVEYRFGDSSVAPDYHRSYVITITGSAKTIAIDSYGNVLLTKQYTNTTSDFQAFKELLSKKGIKKHKKIDSACCGGTSETLRLYKGDETIFDAYVYHCSGESGTLFLPDGTADLFRNQIPENVDSLINSTMQNNGR